MLIYEYQIKGNKAQGSAIEEAIRIVQLIRNKDLRLWIDSRGLSKNDLQCYCALLAKAYTFAYLPNSQAAAGCA